MDWPFRYYSDPFLIGHAVDTPQLSELITRYKPVLSTQFPELARLEILQFERGGDPHALIQRLGERLGQVVQVTTTAPLLEIGNPLEGLIGLLLDDADD